MVILEIYKTLKSAVWAYKWHANQKYLHQIKKLSNRSENTQYCNNTAWTFASTLQNTKNT